MNSKGMGFKNDSTLKMSEGVALQETSIGSSRLTIGNNKTLFRQLVSVCIAVNKVMKHLSSKFKAVRQQSMKIFLIIPHLLSALQRYKP